MFGTPPRPPKPPRHEPYLLLLLAVGIAGLLTAAYAAITWLAVRLQQGG